jgi:3-phenylpropionate/cinnamic acid dioxygenase small subunit
VRQPCPSAFHGFDVDVETWAARGGAEAAGAVVGADVDVNRVPAMGVDASTVADELQIHRLLAEYCHLCDDGEFDALVERFTVDGSFVLGDQATQGRKALRGWYETVQPPERRGKHVTVNAVVDVDGDRAAVVSDFVVLAFSNGTLTPIVAGRYRDELHRVDGRWRFHVRAVTMMAPPQ